MFCDIPVPEWQCHDCEVKILHDVAANNAEVAMAMAKTVAEVATKVDTVKECTHRGSQTEAVLQPQMHSRGSQTDPSSIAGIPLRVGGPGSPEAGVRRVRTPPPPMAPMPWIQHPRPPPPEHPEGGMDADIPYGT